MHVLHASLNPFYLSFQTECHNRSFSSSCCFLLNIQFISADLPSHALFVVVAAAVLVVVGVVGVVAVVAVDYFQSYPAWNPPLPAFALPRADVVSFSARGMQWEYEPH